MTGLAMEMVAAPFHRAFVLRGPEEGVEGRSFMMVPRGR